MKHLQISVIIAISFCLNACYTPLPDEQSKELPTLIQNAADQVNNALTVFEAELSRQGISTDEKRKEIALTSSDEFSPLVTIGFAELTDYKTAELANLNDLIHQTATVVLSSKIVFASLLFFPQLQGHFLGLAKSEDSGIRIQPSLSTLSAQLSYSLQNFFCIWPMVLRQASNASSYCALASAMGSALEGAKDLVRISDLAHASVVSRDSLFANLHGVIQNLYFEAFNLPSGAPQSILTLRQISNQINTSVQARLTPVSAYSDARKNLADAAGFFESEVTDLVPSIGELQKTEPQENSAAKTNLDGYLEPLEGRVSSLLQYTADVLSLAAFDNSNYNLLLNAVVAARADVADDGSTLDVLLDAVESSTDLMSQTALETQNQLNQMSLQLNIVSNVMSEKKDSAKTAISNIR